MPSATLSRPPSRSAKPQNVFKSVPSAFFDENLVWHSKSSAEARKHTFPMVVARTITPFFALAILTERNPINRNLERRRIEEYKQAMLDSNWHLNDQSVTFDTEGNLKNGQHRLTACVEADVSFTTFCHFGLSEDAVFNLDGARPRSVVDIGKMMGRTDLDKFKISATNYLMEVDGHSLFGTEQKLENFEKHREAIDFIAEHLNQQYFKLAPIAAALIRSYYTCRQSKGGLDRMVRFIISLQNGQYNSPGESAACVLNNFILRNRGNKKGNERKDIYRKTIAAVYAYMNNEPIARLMGRNSTLFPLPDEITAAPQK